MITDVSGQWPAAWKTDMLAGAIDTAEYDGKLYGVPWIMDTKYLFLNAAHLSDAHANPQWLDTWEGTLKAARRVKAAGIVKRSEERRVGKECRSRGARDYEKKKEKNNME